MEISGMSLEVEKPPPPLERSLRLRGEQNSFGFSSLLFTKQKVLSSSVTQDTREREHLLCTMAGATIARDTYRSSVPVGSGESEADTVT